MRIYWWQQNDLWKKEGVKTPEMVYSSKDLEQMVKNGFTEISEATAKALEYWYTE